MTDVAAQPLQTPPTAGRILSADTTLLKFISILLIANSHMESLYPRPWMAGDGLLGMAWFFAVAGFGLVLSDRGRQRSFGPWFYRRAVRLYPAVWIALLVADVLLLGEWRHWKPVDYVTRMVWPTHLTFVMAIIPAYILFYLFMKTRRNQAYLLGALAIGIFQIVAWIVEVRGYTRHTRLDLGHRAFGVNLFYFQMMLVGGWLASRIRISPADIPRTRAVDVLLVVLLFLAYVGAKYTMIVRAQFAWAFPVLFLLALLMCVYLCRLSNSRAFLDFIHRRRAGLGLSAVVTFIAALTLEIYLVHSYVMETKLIQSLRFPLNIAVFWPVTIALAFALSLVASPIVRKLQSLETRKAREEPAAGR